MKQLIEDYNQIIQKLQEYEYIIPKIPSNLKANNITGEAYAIAYPIQGLLKYHGLTNPEHRIAFIPSISLNNDSAYTITYVKMDSTLPQDRFFLNGNEQRGDNFIRIKTQLQYIRHYSKINSKFFIMSYNLMTTSNQIVNGKGLGTSASGGAAIAKSVVSILYRNQPELFDSNSIGCLFARYLSGSATRSFIGGFGLWLNHPKMTPLESLAIRLDRHQDKEFLASIDLITVSLESTIKTDQIHKCAPQSPFFQEWLLNRKTHVLQFLDALSAHDFFKIGQLAEYDTLCLHAVTMTASKTERMVLWTPKTLEIINLVQEISVSGTPVFYSIDTGPSVVIMVQHKDTQIIIKELYKIVPPTAISLGKIGESARIVLENSPETKKIREDLENIK